MRQLIPAVFFSAVGPTPGDKVVTKHRIYRYERRRVRGFMPVFITSRTLFRNGVSPRSSGALVDLLNGGARFEARRRIKEALMDGRWEDADAVY